MKNIKLVLSIGCYLIAFFMLSCYIYLAVKGQISELKSIGYLSSS